MIIGGSVIGGCVLVLTVLKLLSCFLDKASKKRADSCKYEDDNLSRNMCFQTMLHLCSLKLSLETPNAVPSIA